MTQLHHPTKRERLWLKEGKRCHYCGRKTRLHAKDGANDKATSDHKTPKCRGGSGAEWNQASACARCNQIKGVLTEAEFRAMPMLDAIRFNDMVGTFGERKTSSDALLPSCPPPGLTGEPP